MSFNSAVTQKPWIETPCIRSAALSREAGCNIYLKLETVQPSGSFKSRGIGNLLQKSITSHGPDKPIHFYCSSGGNAGLACVTAATMLKRPATIVVPNSTSALMVKKLKDLGADVVQIGQHWYEADTYLREVLLGKDENGVYVHPFDHEDIWEGNSSIVEELEVQMLPSGGYDAVVCSVGGGGMFCGIMEGLHNNGRLKGGKGRAVKVLAMETKGADSLNLSVRKGELSRLPGITSIATSLGATQVAMKTFECGQKPDVTSYVVTDPEAAMACVKFADDERIIVESACGASIATAYNDNLRTVLYPELSDEEFEKLNIVVVICGGSNVTLEILERYREKYSQDDMVIEKFHSRGRSRQAQKILKVPFILHDQTEHITKKDPICDNEVVLPRRPAVGILDRAEIAKQVEAFGKVVETKI